MSGEVLTMSVLELKLNHRPILLKSYLYSFHITLYYYSTISLIIKIGDELEIYWRYIGDVLEI